MSLNSSHSNKLIPEYYLYVFIYIEYAQQY